jgi:hypothetical protein
MGMPVKPSEAAALADLVFQELETRSLNDETRGRIAARLGGLGLSAIQPHIGSLARDPLQGSAYYMAVDAAQTPLLLRLATGSSASGAVFRERVLIGRMRPGGGREITVEAIPFGTAEQANIRSFIEQIDTAFQPRPRGAQATIVIGSREPGIAFPIAFEAYRSILKRTAWNAAALAYTDADGDASAAAVWHTAVWAAIRAGWREGYGVETHHIRVGSEVTEAVEESIRCAFRYSKFRLDTSALFDYRADHRTKHGWSEPDVERLYGELPADLRAWIESEYSRPFEMGAVTHRFARHEVRRLAVKFGRSLLCLERLHDAIAEAKRALPAASGGFDFEPTLERAESITRPRELTFCLHWLKARGRPAQSVVPNLAFKPGLPYPETTEQQLEYLRGESWDEIAEYTGVVYPGKPLDEFAHRVGELSAVARHFGATLTIGCASGKQAAVLQLAGRATGGRLNLNLRIEEGPEAGGDARAASRQIVSVAENLRS